MCAELISEKKSAFLAYTPKLFYFICYVPLNHLIMAHIIVSKTELYSKLSIVSKIISGKNTLPAYDNFLFEVDNDSLVKVIAGEDGGQLSANIDCTAENLSGTSFMLNAKTILDGLKDIPEQPLKIEVDTKTVCVRYSNGRFEMAAYDSSEYPKIAINSPEPPYSILGSKFLSGLRQVQFCCANDELRPVMNGVFLDKESDRITFVATDGSSLALYEEKVDFQRKDKSSFILPGKMARILSKITSAAEDVLISIGSDNVSFEFASFVLICRMVEGRYPNYRSVIPDNQNRARLVKDSLLSALKRVSVFSSTSSSLVILKFDSNKITLSGRDYAFSYSAEESVDLISYDGSKIEIGFNSNKLIDLLSNVPTEEVIISLNDPSRAGVITCPDESSITYLLMPLSINQ